MQLSLLALLVAPLAALASNVISVDSNDFHSSIGSTPSLVEFYASWCGHCKTLAPVYEKLADAFASSTAKGKVNIVKIDADGDGKAIGKEYEVKGFPTIKWFPKGVEGEAEDYEGARDLEALTEFVTSKIGVKSQVKAAPAPITLRLDAKTFPKIALSKEKDVLVAFTASWCGHCKALKPTLELVTKDFASESNCIIADLDADTEQTKPLGAEYGVSSFPTLKFFPKGDDQTAVEYSGGRTEADFVKFLNEKCGTHRAVGGGLTDLAGRVASLDSLAMQFFSAVPTSRAAIYDEAAALGESLGSSASYYLRVMQKVVNGTDDFLVKESKRLASMLTKKTLVPKKLDEIKIKANILAAFVEEKAAEGVEVVTEKVKEAAGHLKAEL